MESCEFCILHLSDLHIKSSISRSYSNPLKNLISDIASQVKAFSHVVLVVSGDIVDKGDYANNKEPAVKFFTDLKDRIGCKVVDVQIVPGNHDKARSAINDLISYAHRNKGIEHAKGQVEWEKQQEAFAPFIGLANEIYALFGKTAAIRNTFGAESKTINGTNICFMRFDTSWSSFNENGIRTLRIGDYQRRELNNEYQKLTVSAEKGSPVTLTIGISHHPLNWMTADDEDETNKFVMAPDYLNVDILMCGHVHDRQVLNYFNHAHSLLTLVTGIGGRKDEPDTKEEHRYSIYLFNPKHNTCEIIMRRTKDNLSFDYDYSAYTNEQEKIKNELCYPIKTTESHPFIQLSTVKDSRVRSIFIDNSVLKKIVEVSNSITRFTLRITQLNERYKRFFIETCAEKVDPGTIENISNYLYEGIGCSEDDWNKCLNLVYESFRAFLSEFCDYFTAGIKEHFSDDTKLRAHFRYYRQAGDTYVGLYHSSYPDEKTAEPMQDVKWGSLIRPAFEEEKALVFSANRSYNDVKTKWDDFITIVPQFSNNTLDIRTKPLSPKAKRPVLTFGFSILHPENISQDSSVLYILDYLRLDKIITTLIDEYIRIFDIDFKKFLSYLETTGAARNKTKEEIHNNEEKDS